EGGVGGEVNGDGNSRGAGVIEVMREIPRDLFVDGSLRDQAYEDRALTIGEEQTISQPYIVARMTELLELSPQDKVLEVGTGCGYQTAILAKLACQVYTVERLGSLAATAEKRLLGLNLTHVQFQ